MAARARASTVSEARWQAKDGDCELVVHGSLLLILLAAKDDTTMPALIAAARRVAQRARSQPQTVRRPAGIQVADP